MPEVTILTEAELRQSVVLDAAAVDAIADAFTWLAEDRVEMPPIMHIGVPENNGDVDIKSAYVRGLDLFAVKIGAGFFDNHTLGLPNSPASVVLVSAKTGCVEAVLLDNAYLTDLRTGAAGAVAARHLAPASVEVAGVIGAGAQARYQMRALQVVRPFSRLLVWSRDPGRTADYVEEMAHELGVAVEAVEDAEGVVRHADVVVTTTPARAPLIKARWLHPGQHITAVGADLADKQELEAAVLGRVDRIVCDRLSQCLAMGELHHAVEAGVLGTDAAVTELGEITAGRAPGRQSDAEITLCDLTGTGVQDTAIAALAFENARAGGFGVSISN